MPDITTNPKSPFKFLDAYTLRDKDLFFGREEEVAALYQMVSQNRLILVYGQSGTGKTSLVQCGLAAQFDVTDWYPLFIRRGEDLNDALRQSLRRVLGDFFDTHAETIEEIYANFLRPVYLIFDQLEELFILGDDAEQSAFIHAIRDILDANLPSRIIFVLREEYLAHLYSFERVIPALFDRRLRVEPMNFGNVSRVITGSCERFNISIEDPARNVPLIIEKVSAGRAGIQLPYLQVYLDRFWREDYERTYGSPEEGAPDGPGEDTFPSLTFTTAEIETFGEIGNVLDKFVREQEEQLQQILNQRFSGFPDTGVRRILNAFVTEEGTKRPFYANQTSLPGISPDALAASLHWLEQARILRGEDQVYELAHDTLAGVIIEQRSAEDKVLMEAVRLVRNGNLAYNQGIGALLNQRQLAWLEPLEAELTRRAMLNEDEGAFVHQSRVAARRRKAVRWGSIAAVFVVLAGFLVYALWQAGKIQQAYQDLTVESYKRNIDGGMRFMKELKFDSAIVQFNNALEIVNQYNRKSGAPLRYDNGGEQGRRLLAESQEKLIKKAAFVQLLDRGNYLARFENEVDSLLRARDQFEQAFNLDLDSTRVNAGLIPVRQRLEQKYRDLFVRGSDFLTAGETSNNRNACRQARDYFQQAQRITDTPEIRRGIERAERCMQR